MIFSQILHLLYDKDILEEDAILRWADEKKDAEESDKVFVKQSEKLIQVRFNTLIVLFNELVTFSIALHLPFLDIICLCCLPRVLSLIGAW